MEKLPGVFYYGFDGQPVSREVWSELFMDAKRRRVGEDWVSGIHISTVWLGLDHNFGPRGEGYRPIIFETMCFGGPMDQEAIRCATWEEAQAQHEAVVTLCLLYSDYPASVVDMDAWEFIESYPQGVNREQYVKTFLHSASQAKPSTQAPPEHPQETARTESTEHSSESLRPPHSQ